MSDKKTQRTLLVLGKLRDDLRAQAKLCEGLGRKMFNEQAQAVAAGRAAFLSAAMKADADAR